MLSEGPAQARETGAQVGSEELAEGLMLLRASTLKMIRLQLAMERNDRRVALEAVDELVALDRRLEDYLAEVPTGQLMFRRELEVERAALNREKLTLAAGVIHGGARMEEPAIAPAPEAEPDVGAWDDFAFEPEPRRVRWWPVMVLALLSAMAAGAYWFGLSASLMGLLS